MAAFAATFNATLDRTSISVGESATLSLTFEGGMPKALPALPNIPNLTFESLGQASRYTIVNGAASSSVSFNFQVSSTKPGDYLIPSFQVEVDKQELSSKPLRLHVNRGSVQSSLAFLKLIPSKETVYVGETFPVELQLFLAVKGDNLQMPQIEGDGFTFGKIPQNPTQGNTQIGNQGYLVVTFRLAATAVKTGKLTLGPAQCSLILYIPTNSRSRGLFDDIFGGGVQRKPANLTSESQTITVLPLPPEGQPPDFNGAVGNFSFAASASPTNVIVGDPITVRVQVSGQGNLEAVPFPGGTEWREFKLYPPTSKVETTDPIGLAGVKTFERVVIPQNAGVSELPAIQFSFFDPEHKAYHTVQSAPIPLSVRPSEVAGPQPTVLASGNPAPDATPQTRDIVHIKPYLGTIIGLQEPLLMKPWFLALQAVPLLAWVSALVWRKRQDNLANNPRLRRHLRAMESLRQGLKELARCAGANDGEVFFATVFRLLQEQLGDRLDLPASAITEAVIDERLRARAPEPLVQELHELFQICNQARYAPNRSSQELLALVPKVEGALQELGRLPDAD